MMADSLFIDIVTLTFFKMTEAIHYYENQAHDCPDDENKRLLLYIAGRKKTQRKNLEKIIKRSGLVISLSPPDFEEKTTYLNLYSTPLNNNSVKDIFRTVFENARKEMEFYQFLKIVQKNNMHNSLLNTLIDLSGDFLFDVKMGYLKYSLKKDHIYHSYSVEQVINN